MTTSLLEELKAAAPMKASDPRYDATFYPRVHPLNKNGCCDGHGQVHHGFGALAYCTLCMDPECYARRQREWAIECGEIDPEETS